MDFIKINLDQIEIEKLFVLEQIEEDHSSFSENEDTVEMDPWFERWADSSRNQEGWIEELEERIHELVSPDPEE